jgi:hypothetical protein
MVRCKNVAFNNYNLVIKKLCNTKLRFMMYIFCNAIVGIEMIYINISNGKNKAPNLMGL